MNPVSWLIQFLVGIVKGWIGEKERTHESEEVGSLKQAASTEAQANEATKHAEAGRDHTTDLTADDVRNIKPGTDPDFRD